MVMQQVVCNVVRESGRVWRVGVGGWQTLTLADKNALTVRLCESRERERERERDTSLTVSQVKTGSNTLLFTDINLLEGREGC